MADCQRCKVHRTLILSVCSLIQALLLSNSICLLLRNLSNLRRYLCCARALQPWVCRLSLFEELGPPLRWAVLRPLRSDASFTLRETKRFLRLTIGNLSDSFQIQALRSRYVVYEISESPSLRPFCKAEQKLAFLSPTEQLQFQNNNR